MASKEYLALYLRLAPEFGGTRFGPFEEVETRLGSAPDNDITIPETFWVAGSHVKVLQQSGMGLILAPVERSAAVFLWQSGARRPKQIATSVAVRPGDSFSLVTPEGPRFVVEYDELPPHVVEERMKLKGRWQQKLTADSLKEEGKRQIWVSILTTGPGQLASRMWTFVSTGAILQPRNLFMIAGIAAGYIGTAFLWFQQGGLQSELAEAQGTIDQLKGINASSGTDDIINASVEQLVGLVLQNNNLVGTLTDDKDLGKAVKEQAVSLLQSSDYDWLINKPQSGDRQVYAFVQMRKSLEDTIKQPELARVLSFAAAPAKLSDANWALVPDSQGEDVCGRGPMTLTYRQGQNLGLNPRLDALILGDPKEYQGDESIDKRLEALRRTDTSAIRSDPDQLESTETKLNSLGNRTACLNIEGEDKRDQYYQLAVALAGALGPEAPGLPKWESEPAYNLSTRIAKIYAADFQRVDYKDLRDPGIDLTRGHIGPALNNFDNQGAWALKQTARTIARSFVLPCRAVLNRNNDDESLKEIFGDTLPDEVNCLILDYRLRNG
jgi:hypothetical protein